MKLEIKKDITDSFFEARAYYEEEKWSVSSFLITVTIYHSGIHKGVQVETYQKTYQKEKIIKPWCVFIPYKG